MLKQYAKEPIFKGENSPLELKKDFIELQDGELEDRELKNKREIEGLLFKPIIGS